MKVQANKNIWLVAVISLTAILAFAFGTRAKLLTALNFPKISPASETLSTLPPTMIWAWERPETLDFIDPKKVGVAFLAKTIYLRGENVVIRPRLQLLKVPNGTRLVAVIRIESDRDDHPRLTTFQVERSAREIVVSSQMPNISGVQIDFDATLSERNFYRQLLLLVRARLPVSTPLSITALASWCDGDNWLSDLPVDETVPMLFRMGIERRQFVSRFQSGEKFRKRSCQSVAGVSTDEPVGVPSVERIYIFSPKPWSQVSFNDAMEAYQR